MTGGFAVPETSARSNGHRAASLLDEGLSVSTESERRYQLIRNTNCARLTYSDTTVESNPSMRSIAFCTTCEP